VDLAQQGDFDMTYVLPVSVDPTVFRAYDIRGIAEEVLTESVYYVIGISLGKIMRESKEKTVVIGRDGRLSSKKFAEALIAGVSQMGISVKDIGLVPTPLLYFSTHYLPYHSGLIVTGSHNPKNYNGLKMVLQGQVLSTESIQKVREIVDNICKQRQLPEVTLPGVVEDESSIPDAYIDCVKQKIQLAKALTVVIDAGNGAAGQVAVDLFNALGCRVIALYCDIDGNFPNHHPNPGDPKNLVDLQQAVLDHSADIGLAFDGDADRLGVVDNLGEIIYPDRLLMLFAKDLLESHPNAKVIYDVKCSRHLDTLIRSWGGQPIMAKTGHSLIRRRMIMESAMLAGEISGHIFFVDNWFSFDDGLYAGCKLLDILAKKPVSSAELFSEYTDDVTTEELLQPVVESEKFDWVKRLIGAAENQDNLSASIIKIDGLRLEFDDGWGLVRASNTTPCLTLRFAGIDDAAKQRVRNVFASLFNTVGLPLTV
tara:strand:- start:968 stop:2413 length:1446 start_codon:yes stop_codon:yes gene_type:complete